MTGKCTRCGYWAKELFRVERDRLCPDCCERIAEDRADTFVYWGKAS